MPYDPEIDGPLRGGASNEGDEYAYGISPKQAARIVDAILEEERLTGGAPSTTPLESGGHRNRHLDGYANPRRWD